MYYKPWHAALEKEKENSNSHQLNGYLKMQITCLINLI